MDPVPLLSVRTAAEEITPGSPCRVAVTVTNLGTDPSTVSVSVAGLDPAWVHLPPPVGPLAPGAVATTEVVVTVPLGHPPSRLVASVVATDSTGGQASGDLDLTVIDGSVVAAALEPPEARGGRRGRAEVVLRNRGRTPVRVDLDPSSPDREMKVRLSGATQVLGPGQEVRVRARLVGPRPVLGSPRRRPYVIGVRTRGTPVFVEGAFVQRSMMPLWATKAVAIVAVVALWVAVAAVGITSLSSRVNKSANQQAANNNPPASVPAGPTGGGGTGASGGGGSAGGAGGAGGGGGGSVAGGGAGSGQLPSRLSGKVAASTPGGVTVTVTPTSLTDSPTPVAVAVADIAPASSRAVLTSATSAPLTKLYGPALTAASAPTPGTPLKAMTTTTSPDGFWAFAGIGQPGYYLVSFSKAGYATADYVVDVTGDGKPLSLSARLVPGAGSLSGTVDGPHGPLGGVQLTITDGTVSLTTRTPTVGAVGSWAVHGLTTPDTYLITATLPGYSTQTSLVTLGAGSSQSPVTLNMTPGEGSVGGTVVSARTGQPVGGLSVTISDAAMSRTTTTTTVGAVGTYSLPDLPVPGIYALTIAGPGYVSQTQQVSLTSDPSTDNATVNATVTPSTAEVTGLASAAGAGLAGAGAVLANQQNTYKTLTTSGGTVGSFSFPQVPPGQYVLTLEKYGYATVSAQVSVAPGQVQTVNLSLTPVPQQSLATGTVQGVVESLATAKPVVGAEISLDGQPTSVTTDASGAFAVHDVAPGTHTVTADCPTATTCQSLDLASHLLAPVAFESTTVQVTLALGALAFAPTILMPQLDRVAGVVVDGTGARVPYPVVTMTNAQTGIVYQPVTDPTASGATPAQGGFEFDGLPHGNYTLVVKGPPVSGTGGCAGTSPYKPLTTSVQLQPGVDVLLNGAPGTANPSPVLTLLPDYRVKTFTYPAGATAPVPAPGVTVTVNGVAGTASAGFSLSCTGTGTSNELDIPLPLNLVGAPFTASFTYTDSNKVVYSAPTSAPFTAVYNNTTVDSALLVPPTPGVSITVSFPWRTPTGVLTCAASATAVGACPGLSAADEPAVVALSVTATEPGGGTGSRTIPATTVGGSGIWTIPASALVGTVPGAATFTVDGGAFQHFSSATNTTDAGFATQAFTLTPNPSTVTGTLASPVGASISVAPAAAGLSISTNASATDNIVWQESGQGTGEAYPGVYNLTFTDTGYDTAVLEGFSVPLCDATCTDTLGVGGGGPPTVTDGTYTYTPGPTPDPTANLGVGAISLTAHVTLVVTPAFSPLPGLGYPTVTVQNGAGQTVATVPLSSSVGTATIGDLTSTENDYTVTVAAPGYQTSVSHETLPAATTPSTVTDAPLLTAEGYLSGLVDGLIYNSASPLAGAKITATLTTAGTGCSAAATPATLSAATGTDGTFTITNPSASDGGICPSSVYSVGITAPAGYTSPTTTYPVTVVAGDNAVNGGSPIDVAATQVPQTFTVTGAGGTPLQGVAIVGTSTIGRTVTGTTDATGTAVMTPAPDPTTYTYSFALAQYAPLTETIGYHIGDQARTTSVPLTLNYDTVEGTVTTPGSCATPAQNPCPLAGVVVTLLNSKGNKVDSMTTGTDGSYKFPSASSVKITDGSYRLEATLAGYQYASGYQQSFVTSPSLTTIQDVSLTPSPVNLSVAVGTNLKGVSLTGDTVSLSPATPPTGLSLTCPNGGTLAATGFGNSQTASVPVNGKASFSGVVPDFYDLTVTGSGVPAQADDGLLVCPGGNVAEYVPATSTSAPAASATFTVLMGTITGTAAVSANSSISPSDLTVTFSNSSGPVDTVSVGSTGQYTSDYLPLGSYTVQASTGTSGYSPSNTDTVDLSTTSPPTGPVSATPTLTVSPAPVPVTVTVTDATTGAPVPAGLTVTITDSPLTPITGISATTNSSGMATFSSVNPDPSNDYTATVGSLTIASGATFQVSIGSSNVSAPVSVDYTGGITGTVTTTAGPVTVDVCSAYPCTTPVKTSAPTSGAYSLTGLDPGSYYVEVTGATSSGVANPVTVTSGGTAPGPTFTYGGSLTGTVSGTAGTAGTSVTVTLCSDSTCATKVGTPQVVTLVAGATPYTFAGVAPGQYWEEATTTAAAPAKLTPAGITGAFSVTSGTPSPGQNYSVG